MLIDMYSGREAERVYAQELIHRRIRSIDAHIAVVTENILVLALRGFDHEEFLAKAAELSEDSVDGVALARAGRAGDEGVGSQTVNVE